MKEKLRLTEANVVKIKSLATEMYEKFCKYKCNMEIPTLSLRLKRGKLVVLAVLFPE